MEKFNDYINTIYKQFIKLCINEDLLSNLVFKSGKKLNKKEWENANIIDLSTMPRSNIVINSFSNGNNFETNIYTLDNKTLLYGSIRPYLRKCGFTWDVSYVAGTVHSFKPLDEDKFYWLLAVLQSEDFHKNSEIKSQGTKMPIITWEGLTSYKTSLLLKDDLNKFNKFIIPVFNKIIGCMLENRKLNILKQLYLKKFFD